jgi:type I restriction enzyme, S subunit
MSQELPQPGQSGPKLLPTGWCWATVDDVIEQCQYGSSAKTGEDPSGIPVLRMGNIQDGRLDLSNLKYLPHNHHEFPNLLLQEGDLLFNRTNSVELVGKSAVYLGQPSPCSYASYLVALRFGLGCDPKYLCHFLNSHHGKVWVRSVVSQQVGQANVNSTKLRALRFPLAPLNEQRRIIAKIEELVSDLDAGVAALERIKASLKRYRAAVLKAAVEGRLTEEWRGKHTKTEPASKLLERILAERRQKWEEEQLAKFAAADKSPPKGWREKYVEPAAPDTTTAPELPQGWCWVALGQVARFQNGRAFPSKEYAPEGVRLLRPGNLFADGSVRWTEKNSRFMPAEWAEKHPTYIVRGNELVINLTAQSLADEFLGRTCLTDPDECCLLNQRLARITPFSGMDKKFTLYLLKSSTFRSFVNGLNTGSLIEHMFISQLEDCCLPMPPAEEQQEIVQEIERRFSIIEENEAQVDANLKRAARLRQSILKRTFEGRLMPQDPTDEPADKLLDRIRPERATANGSVAPRTRRGRASSQQTEDGTDGIAS